MLNENEIKFGSLSEEDKISLVSDFITGKNVQILDGDGCWKRKTGNVVLFRHNFVYRTVLSKPQIDWDHVSPLYNYMATDADGHTHLYEKEPKLKRTRYPLGEWYHGGNYVNCHCFSSFVRGDCDAADSLVKRT